MNYEKFVAQVEGFPIFGEDLFNTLDIPKASRTVQIHRWVKKNKLIRLKRGLYTLPESKRRIQFSLKWLANALYSPSYLSLEYALSWYDMIPERVEIITSITPLKTATFQNPLSRFIYRSIKKDLFFGFFETQDDFQRPILMATPEKALLDYIYLYPYWESTHSFLEENLRLQQLHQLQKKRLKNYSEKFASKKIDAAVKLLLEVKK